MKQNYSRIFIYLIALCIFCISYPATSGQSKVEMVIQTGHHADITSLAVSPNNKYVATGGLDNVVILWDASTLKQLKTLTGHSRGITSITFSPNDRYLLTASYDSTAILWDYKTGTEVLRLKGHSGAVTSADFLYDSNIIATGSADKTAKIWQTSSGQLIYTYSGHKEAVTSVKFSPSGDIVTGSKDGTAKLWGLLPPRTEKMSFTGDTKETRFTKFDLGLTPGLGLAPNEKTPHLAVTCALFSPNGQVVITCGKNNEEIRFWNKSTGELLTLPRKHEGYVTSLCFDASSTKFVTSSYDGTVRLWYLKQPIDYPIIASEKFKWVLSATFSPNDKHIYAIRSDSREILKVETPYDSPSPFGSSYSMATIENIKGEQAQVFSATFSPNGEYITAAFDNGNLAIWNIKRNKYQTLQIIPSDNQEDARIVISLFFSPDSKKLIAVTKTGSLYIWNSESGEFIQKIDNVFSDLIISYTNIAQLSPDGKYLATGGSKGTLWNISTSQKIQTYNSDGKIINAVSFSPDGELLILGGGNIDYLMGAFDLTKKYGWVGIYEVASGKIIREFSEIATMVRAVKFGPKGNIFAVNTDEGVKVFNVKNGNLKQNYKDSYSDNFIFDTKGDLLFVSKSHENKVKMFNVKSGNLIQEFVSSTGSLLNVNSLCLDPEDRVLLTASDDNTLKFWNIRTGSAIGTLFIMSDGEWIVQTADGKIDFSNNATRHISLVKNLEIITDESYLSQIKKSDLLSKMLK